MTTLSLDYETRSATPIKDGADRYFADRDAGLLLCAWRFDRGPVRLWDRYSDGPFPREVAEALFDPHVTKRAFNASFERQATTNLLAIPTPYEAWRCTMVRSYALGFMGGLGDVAAQMGLPTDHVKDPRGKRLIRLFCEPQVKGSVRWASPETHPREWQEFREYCPQDVVAETAVGDFAPWFDLSDDEWALYALDQRINDTGLPIDVSFVEAAAAMAERVKAAKLEQIKRLTGVDNPQSVQQVLAWLRERGYPSESLAKEDVGKALRSDAVPDDAKAVLRLRAEAAKSSTDKYDAILRMAGHGGRIRGCFQFLGGSRTGRWAGRGLQPQNLARTPGALDDEDVLEQAVDAVKDGDAAGLDLFFGESMSMLGGLIRSAIAAAPGCELRVSDYNAIENRVVGWLSGCEAMLDVFREGRDPYKDFAVDMYRVAYEDVTKAMRNAAKPPTLACPYGLSAGEILKDGTRTGLLAYADRMGIAMTPADSKRSVQVFHGKFPEIKAFWREIETVIPVAVEHGTPGTVGKFVHVERRDPFLVVRLPSGRPLFYHRPEMVTVWFASRDRADGTRQTVPLGEDEPRARRAEAQGWSVYSRRNLSYWGKAQDRHAWTRIITHPGKTTEQWTQFVARDVLSVGLSRAAAAGFTVVGHVHDEIITEQRLGDNERSLSALEALMAAPIDWAPGLPMAAKGWTGKRYKKD